MMPSTALVSALSSALNDAPATNDTATAAASVASPTPLWALLVGFAVLGGSAYAAAHFLIRPMHLALGFATTAAMWLIGYIAMTAPGLWFGEALFALTLAVPVVFGAIARRGGASPVKTGLVSAFANLLVIGAFLRDPDGPLWVPGAYVGGLFAASAGLAWFGGYLARNARPIELPPPASLFARVAAATVFILLVTGGLVTGLESGLAVPDWPNSFGHNMLLYPISEMKGGIYYEHAHRLFGMLVGSTALMLVNVVFRDERRNPLARAVSLAFLAMVCVQGLLGGLRVTGNLTTATSGIELSPSTVLAIVHGMFGQIVFVTACVIACVTSRTWIEGTRASGLRDSGRLRTLPLLLVVAMLGQLFLGASYRHLQIPPSGGNPAVHPAWPIWGHVFGAFLVLVLAVVAGAHASSRAREIRPIRFFGKALVHGVGLQFALGIGALVVVLLRVDERIPLYEVATTSAHQAFGALLLACATMLAIWSLRLVAQPGAETAGGSAELTVAAQTPQHPQAARGSA